MSNDSTGRTPRSAGNSAPMGSTIAIVVTAVAVILGFLILRKVNNNHDTTSQGGGTTTTQTSLPDSSSTDLPTTTLSTVNKTATKVQVANASKISGVAKQMTTALTAAGFDMAAATNAVVTNPATTTKVIYNQADPNALGVAQALAQVLGNVAVEVAANPPPVKDGSFAAGSAVIVLLGADLAGKPLPNPGGTGTTVPGVTAVPTTA